MPDWELSNFPVIYEASNGVGINSQNFGYLIQEEDGLDGEDPISEFDKAWFFIHGILFVSELWGIRICNKRFAHNWVYSKIE